MKFALQHRPGAVDARPHRPARNAEHLRDLLVRQPLDVAEHQREPVLLRDRRDGPPYRLLELLALEQALAALGRIGEQHSAVLERLLKRIETEPVPASHPAADLVL